MLLEMLIALTFLAIAVGALMSMYASNLVSLRHASTEGTALTLVERQMEAYKAMPYASIRLNQSTVPSPSTDPYRTANAGDSTIPSASAATMVWGGTVGSGTCAAPTTPQPECAVQYWTGPDGLAYRVDTYIVSGAPVSNGPGASPRSVKSITVIARRVVSGSTDTKIWGRTASVIDQANPPV
jgi:hypothetical protein